MSNRTVLLIVAVVALVAVVAGVSIAAGPKQYQFTGEVKQVDTAAKTLSVDKAGDVWEFSTDGLKDLKVKKGDKVTVYYTMSAKKIEGR
jgi:hypothetical protein